MSDSNMARSAFRSPNRLRELAITNALPSDAERAILSPPSSDSKEARSAISGYGRRRHIEVHPLDLARVPHRKAAPTHRNSKYGSRVAEHCASFAKLFRPSDALDHDSFVKHRWVVDGCSIDYAREGIGVHDFECVGGAEETAEVQGVLQTHIPPRRSSALPTPSAAILASSTPKILSR
ncbi:hypothetical protein OH77DRAFT_1593926 [Trametes cingulata]|nr:hypothetical protein OH77DRAFT_1593926 [Trametes cingulata]